MVYLRNNYVLICTFDALFLTILVTFAINEAYH